MSSDGWSLLSNGFCQEKKKEESCNAAQTTAVADVDWESSVFLSPPPPKASLIRSLSSTFSDFNYWV